jgi:hypothetical protein
MKLRFLDLDNRYPYDCEYNNYRGGMAPTHFESMDKAIDKCMIHDNGYASGEGNNNIISFGNPYSGYPFVMGSVGYGCGSAIAYLNGQGDGYGEGSGSRQGSIDTGGDGGYDEYMGYFDHKCHDDYWHSCCY